jgi:hypothetical protein
MSATRNGWRKSAVNSARGYHFSAPLPAGEVLDFIARHADVSNALGESWDLV